MKTDLETSTNQSFSWAGHALVALALSVGWGIRGNFGHEYGAMIPGALSAIAVALASGRSDWLKRFAHFGFLGAVGWSFGGGISYMQVIAYTHSGHSNSALYGFACLTLIGFCWAALGGAFTAFPAFLDRSRLTALYVPALIVFGAWIVQDFAVAAWHQPGGDSRHENPLYWFDTDWIGASVALMAMAVYCGVRRWVDFGSSLVIHMAAGWWVGFAGLVLALGFRMTPPRGDNWSGGVGLVLGLLVFLVRQRLNGVLWVMLVSGSLGGIAFALATTLKLVAIKSGLQTNWHSLLEQTYGLLNGLAISLPMSWVCRRQPEVDDESTEEGSVRRRWTSAVAVTFVLGVVTYVNFTKNVAEWIKLGAVPPLLAGVPATYWYTGFYALLIATILGLTLRHLRRPLAIVPESAAGRAQLLFAILLWWVVVGNYERVLIAFKAVRLVTEGVIFVNACLCTLLAFTLDRSRAAPAEASRPRYGLFFLLGSFVVCAALVAGNIFGDWWVVRALHGDTFTGEASLHIRFGPNATVTPKPVKGAAHP